MVVDNSMLLCFKLLVPRVSYLWPYRLCGFTFLTDINTPALLYHPTQLSIHYVFCGAKSYFVGSLDWLAWQDRRKQPCLAQREEERSVGVVEGDDCFACLLVILSDSQAESNCKLD